VSHRAWRALAIVLAGCGKPTGTPATAPEPSGPAAAALEPSGPHPAVPDAAAVTGARCEALPFAPSTVVPEASGAAWLTHDGRPALLVVGDSGNHGAYGIIDPETGATIETGRLPLSELAGDDVEGVAARGEKIYSVTSSGWIRVWRRSGARFELIEPPYPLGPVDLPDTKNNDRAPKGDGMVCGAHVVNCGRNYEGMCLAHAPRNPGCIGFAASKADGHLYCLSEQAGKLVVHRNRAIAITRPGALADCAFSDDDTLWAGSNLFGLARIYRVTGWDDPEHATLDRIGSVGIGFPELIAARGDVVYRMSDMSGSPSLMARYRCTR
jgi:outer membrane protein assembly factor BamB